MTVATLLLIAVGAALELGGVVLVAREYRGTRRAMENYLANLKQVVQIGTAFDWRPILDISALEGQTDPDTWSLRATEALARLEQVLMERVDDQRDYLQQFAQTEAKIVMDRVREVAGLLLAMNDTKAMWRRRASVALLISGIAVTSVGASLSSL